LCLVSSENQIVTWGVTTIVGFGDVSCETGVLIQATIIILKQ